MGRAAYRRSCPTRHGALEREPATQPDEGRAPGAIDCGLKRSQWRPREADQPYEEVLTRGVAADAAPIVIDDGRGDKFVDCHRHCRADVAWAGVRRDTARIGNSAV